MSATLYGTGRVADDVYLLAHSDVTGKPFVQPRALGLGLAGGLLAELALTGSVRLWQDSVTVASRAQPWDGLAGRVLSLLQDEQQDHPAREWLLFLARTATADVAARLAGSGYLVRAKRWGKWRGERWAPADSDAAFAPLLRVRAAFSPARPPSAYDVVLAGLADACGLGFHLAEYIPPGTACSVEELVAQLHPSLRELVAQTRAAVDAAVLAQRI